MFHRTLREQIDTKSRIKNGCLHARFSFGKVKAGLNLKQNRIWMNMLATSLGLDCLFLKVKPQIRHVLGKLGRRREMSAGISQHESQN